MSQSSYSALAAVGLLVLCMLPGTGHTTEGIVTTSGELTVIEPPDAVLGEGGFEDANTMFIFGEVEGLVLPSDLAVDSVGEGTFVLFSDLTPGTIPAGTAVNSYLFHHDGPGILGHWLTGSATFEQDILGIILEGPRLIETDLLLGSGFPVYPSSDTGRGLSLLGNGNDVLGVLGGTVTLDSVTVQGIDHVRVITASTAVPEPSSALLLVLGLGGVMLSRSRG